MELDKSRRNKYRKELKIEFGAAKYQGTEDVEESAEDMEAWPVS